MTSPYRLALVPVALLLAVGGVAAQQALQPSPAAFVAGGDNAEAARRALAEAKADSASAAARARTLESEAAGAVAAAERTAQQSAALAARIQQAQAEIAGAQAQVRLIELQRVGLRATLAERQRPLMELTAALQRLTRRPAILSLLRPASIDDAVHLRAVLASMVPEVQRRTAALRSEIERGKALALEAGRSAEQLRQRNEELKARRADLLALEARQRVTSTAAVSEASRESERALALGEQARDLDALLGDLTRAAVLREQLAALPGPIMRPPLPAASQVLRDAPPPASATFTPLRYMLPAAGRLVLGFGEAPPGRARSRGIALAPRAGGQAVAPGAGRVVFAGPYQGYGTIVIIDHGGGWTSLVTGLAQLDTAVGREVVAGSPLGLAGPGIPVLTVELRRQGEPVNPLDYLKG